MKKQIALMAMLLWSFVALVKAQNIAEAEYFIDMDNGFGMNTSITVSSPSSEVTLDFNIPISTLEDGLHTLYVRAKDSNGIWSIATARAFLKVPDPLVGVEIVEAEYFINTDQGLGQNTAIDLSSGATVSVDLNVSLSALANGIHKLYVRVKDSNGKWSIYGDALIFKAEDPLSSVTITSAEYFIDTDPGYGNGTAVPVSMAGAEITSLFNVDVSNESPGLHRLYVRTKDDQGNWSINSSRLIQVVHDGLEPIQNIAYFYTGDDDFRSSLFSADLIPYTPDLDADFLLDASELTIGEMYTLNAKPIDARGTEGTLVSIDFLFDGSIAWLGGAAGEETNWSVALNWDTNTIPSADDNVVIPPTANDPVVAQYHALNDLTIEENAALTLESGAALAIYGNVINDGTYTVHRNTTGNAGYSILSSPVVDETIADLNADYTYEFDGTGFSVATGNMTPGKGYFIGYDAPNPMAHFVGDPNYGSISSDVTSGNFALLGNPYAAPISIADFLNDNNAVISGAVYFWDDGGSNVNGNRGGDYISANAVGTVSIQQPNDLDDGVNGLQGTSAVENGVIPSTQGFFVESLDDATVHFDPVHQVIGDDLNSDANFYRLVEFQKLKLSLEGNGLYNETLLGFSSEVSRERDLQYDAKKLDSDYGLAFSSLLDQERYAIQALPLQGSSTQIQLEFSAQKAGDYTLSIADQSLDPRWNIDILDQKTGEVHNLSESNYVFNTATTTNDQRFKLVVGTDEPLLVTKSSIQVHGNQNQIIIEGDLRFAEVHLSDIQGRVLVETSGSFEENRMVIETPLKRDVVYFLKVNDEIIKFLIN